MDLAQILKDYKPIEIELLEQKGYKLSENVKSSFLLYNNALMKLSAKSEDIAIIELKKAIAVNPDFIDAFNLLGVCYLYINDNLKAEEMFNKVAAVENNGVKAYKYLSMLRGEEANPAKGKYIKDKAVKEKVKPVQSDNQANYDNFSNKTAHMIKPIPTVKPAAESGQQQIRQEQPVKQAQPVKTTSSIKTSQSINDKSVYKNSFGKFLNGLIAGVFIAALIFAIILIGVNKSFNEKLVSEREAITGSESSKSSLEAQINEYKNKITQLEADSAKQVNELKSANTELDYFKNTQKLFEVDKLIAAGNFEAACDMLLSLKATDFKGAEKEKYDYLLKDTAPKAAWAVYNQGTIYFNAQNYKDALTKLVKVEKYDPNWQYLSWVMYQIGVSYKELGEKDNALNVFQKIKEKYPTSEYAAYSDYRINEIKGG